MAMSKIGLSAIDFMKLNGRSIWRTDPENTADEEIKIINTENPENAIIEMEEEDDW